MKEQLTAARESIARGNGEAAVETAEQIKRLPRTADGLFDTVKVDGDCFEAARWVYPVYAYYETEYNKKEDYPDLTRQMETLNEKRRQAHSLKTTALFLDALIHTIDNVTPQLYEYYIELADMFKTVAREAIADYYKEGRFTDGSGCAQESEALIRAAIAHAGETYVLLAEKYEQYC